MNINWSYILNSNFFSITIPAVVTILGWLFVSWQRNKEAIKERQREINISYLINAHRVLSNWVHNENLTQDEKDQIEGVIADIQLLGSNRVINTLNNFLDSYNKGGDPTRLLDTLVSDLRSELNMEQITSKRKFFRFN
ncbi:hypothetical protein [Legionella cardiaca]|uniref:Transmembrane protein n=1 Tax=Legionella cardiaca TaxID=1071983 RepID=A0ABY8ANK1_9GAMM|nr:hypothetical protein [Legionella cardiaca]WED42225.1 hypothetical protein PXX05_09820 [Legionella cardiaca]